MKYTTLPFVLPDNADFEERLVKIKVLDSADPSDANRAEPLAARWQRRRSQRHRTRSPYINLQHFNQIQAAIAKSGSARECDLSPTLSGKGRNRCHRYFWAQLGIRGPEARGLTSRDGNGFMGQSHKDSSCMKCYSVGAVSRGRAWQWSHAMWRATHLAGARWNDMEC